MSTAVQLKVRQPVLTHYSSGLRPVACSDPLFLLLKTCLCVHPSFICLVVCCVPLISDIVSTYCLHFVWLYLNTVIIPELFMAVMLLCFAMGQ